MKLTKLVLIGIILIGSTSAYSIYKKDLKIKSELQNIEKLAQVISEAQDYHAWQYETHEEDRKKGISGGYKVSFTDEIKTKFSKNIKELDRRISFSQNKPLFSSFGEPNYQLIDNENVTLIGNKYMLLYNFYDDTWDIEINFQKNQNITKDSWKYKEYFKFVKSKTRSGWVTTTGKSLPKID